MYSFIVRLSRDTRGQDLIEYGRDSRHDCASSYCDEANISVILSKVSSTLTAAGTA